MEDLGEVGGRISGDPDFESTGGDQLHHEPNRVLSKQQEFDGSDVKKHLAQELQEAEAPQGDVDMEAEEQTPKTPLVKAARKPVPKHPVWPEEVLEARDEMATLFSQKLPDGEIYCLEVAQSLLKRRSVKPMDVVPKGPAEDAATVLLINFKIITLKVEFYYCFKLLKFNIIFCESPTMVKSTLGRWWNWPVDTSRLPICL